MVMAIWRSSSAWVTGSWSCQAMRVVVAVAEQREPELVGGGRVDVAVGGLAGSVGVGVPLALGEATAALPATRAARG